MDCSLPGASVHRIFQARIPELVAISLSKDLPNPGIESVSPLFAGGFFTTEPPGKVKESELLYGVRPGHLRQMWSQGFSWLCEFLQVRFSVSLPTPFSFLHKKQ